MTCRQARKPSAAAVCTLAALVAAVSALMPGDARSDPVPYVTRITGIDDGDLRSAVESVSRLVRMEEDPPASLGALRRRVVEDLELFSNVLRSQGYYDHAIDYRLDTSEQPLRVRIRVDPGPAYELVDFDVVLRGEGLDVAMEAVQRAKETADLGRRAAAKQVLDAEREVLRELTQRAFPYPKVADRKVIVDHAARTLDVTTTIETGRRAVFGPVRVEGVEPRLRQYTRHRVPWRQGELYDPDQLDTLRTRLSSTGLFSGIRVRPGREVPDDRRLPIVVELDRAKPRTIGVGVGYSSSEGAGASAYWEHRNLFGRAERLRFTGEAAEIGQTGSILFRKPDFFSVSQTLLFDSSYDIEETEAYEAEKFRTSLAVERPFGRHWTWLAGGAFEIGPVDEADGTERDVLLVGVPVLGRRDTSNSILDPTLGSRLELGVTPYLDELGSDVSFLSARIGNAAYFALDARRRLVVAGRVTIGSLSGADSSEIPPDKRFYAGGGGSIRGFGYQLAGPLDEDEDPVGGRSLVEMGAELRWRFMDSFGVVPFVDAGNVFDDVYPSFDGDALFWGAGLGLRYFSPVGPIRLDVATPLNGRDGVDDPVQFYISLGQAY